ncbi:PA domain-containing protein [Penicillium angulare]|uniref:PA domain-containing protein n=1 Tax=Penicillium angulare TaxID=116970 RepID=A0A9W9EUH5_9EURO|nr:PA domain-containing protein [Penicillium angulare]
MDVKRSSSWLLTSYRGKRRRERLILFFATILSLLVFWKCYRKPPLDLLQLLLSVPSGKYLRGSSFFYTSSPHFAGQGLKQAQWTLKRWKEFGITDSHIVSYDAQLPVPTDQQRLTLLRGSEILYEAPLNDNDHGFPPAFYSFVSNANITASYVFANFGADEDYDDLMRNNISIAGKIAVLKSADASAYLQLRQLETSREVQVRVAQNRGLIGVLLYPDPQNDYPITESNGYNPYPKGPARPAEMIERGGIGPYDSYQNGLIPTIPCMPMSYADALPILTALNGYGPLASELGTRWQGGELGKHGVRYNVGPSPPGIFLNIVTEAYIHSGQVHNVIGKIPGALENEIVILGNHRDAWGPGAGDPNSGSAVLNEVVRSFGKAVQHGWRPQRTLMFASWEGEEIGQIGSLPWIKEHFEWLNATTVSYLNVVVAGSGKKFHVKASPLLYRTVLDAMRHVRSPNQNVSGQSVFDVWNASGAGIIGTPGGGDAIRFQGLLCASTVDFGFSQGLRDNVFPYHSGLDSFEWISQYGDPGWEYHLATTKLWLVMAAHLSELPILDMRATDYADAIERWITELFANRSWSKLCDPATLYSAIARLTQVAKTFDDHVASLKLGKHHWWKFWTTNRRILAINELNQGYIRLERAFYHERGLDSRPSSHHVLYEAAPWHTDKPPLPGLSNSLRAENWSSAEVRFTFERAQCDNAMI